MLVHSWSEKGIYIGFDNLSIPWELSEESITYFRCTIWRTIFHHRDLYLSINPDYHWRPQTCFFNTYLFLSETPWINSIGSPMTIMGSRIQNFGSQIISYWKWYFSSHMNLLFSWNIWIFLLINYFYFFNFF